MARVTVFQGGSVEAQGTTRARLQPADFGDSGVARGLQAVGQAGAQAVNAFAELENRKRIEVAETSAKEADNRLATGLSDALENPETGYRAKRGRNAVTDYEATISGLEKMSGEIARDMPPGLARQTYEDVAARRLLAAREVAGRHYFTERETWQDDTSLSRIKLAESDAGNAYDSPEAAETHISTAVEELAALGRRKGWDEATLASKTLGTVSTMRRDIAERLSDLNPELGDKYLGMYRAQVTSEDADAIEDSVRRGRAAILDERRRLEREANQARKEQIEAMGEEARDTVDMMERGNAVDPGSVEKLATRLDESGKPVLAAKLRTTSAAQAILSEGRQWAPAQLQQWINDTRSRTGKNASLTDASQLAAGEKLLGEMKTELQRDPLSWAVKAGVARVEPLRDVQSMQVRVVTGLAVAKRYGTKPTFLTDEEAASLGDKIATGNVQQKLDLVSSLANGFGRHSRDVLAKLSNNDPVFAHAAALSSAGGYRAITARRIFAGQEAIRTKAVNLPSADQFDTTDIGTAMNFAPRTKGAVIESAKALYAQIMNERGATSPKVATGLWLQALNRAAGATYTGDNQRVGGFGEHRGVKIVLPTDVSPDEFPVLMGRLSDADLKAQGPLPRYGNGKAASAADIRSAFLFDAGDGRYYVSLDRRGTQFVQGERGSHYVLNLGAISTSLRGRRAPTPQARTSRRGADY